MNSFKDVFNITPLRFLGKNERKNVLKINDDLTKHYSKKEYDVPSSYPMNNTSYPMNKITTKLHHLQNYTEGGHIGSTYLWDKHSKYDTSHYDRGIDVDSEINGLDEALNHIKTPRSFNVYSNIRSSPIYRMNSEGIVHHPGYISSSINKDYAINQWRNGNHTLKIHVPKGHAGTYVGQHISTVPGQHEFILPHGLNLKWIKSEKIKPRRRLKDYDYYLHHMDIESNDK